VGDVVRVLPAIKILKKYYPASSIAWVVEEPSEALLESQPEIENVFLFPRRRWTEGIQSPKRIWKTIAEGWKFILDLRKERFDVVLDFHGILKSGLISILSGSPRRVGFDRKSSKEGNFLFSNVKVRFSDDRKSRFHKNIALLKGVGLNAEGLIPTLHIPERDRTYVESFFNTLPPSF